MGDLKTTLLRYVGSPAFRQHLWWLLFLEAAAALLVFSPWIAGDSQHYLKLADSLGHGWYGTVTDAGPEPDVTRPPGYPLLIAFTTHVLRLPISILIGFQAIAYTASIALFAWFLRNRGEDDRVFLVLAVIYPFGLIYSVAIMAEAWALLGLGVIAIFFANGDSPKRYAIIGIICGLLSLLRSDLLLLPILLMILAITAKPKLFARATILPAAAFITLLPYTLWNGVTHGLWLPAPAASAVGTSLYLATWQRELPLEDLEALYGQRVTARVAATNLDEEISRTNTSVGAPELLAPFNPIGFPTSELQRSIPKAYGDLAVERIKANPWPYVSHVVRNTWDLWNTSNYPKYVPSAVAAILTLISYSVFVLGVGGALIALYQPRDWPLPRAFVFIAAYPAAIHWLLHTEARYTAPSRSLLIMFAACFVIHVFRSTTNRN